MHENANFRELTCDMVGRAEADTPAFFPSVNVETTDQNQLGFIPFSNFDSDYVRTSVGLLGFGGWVDGTGRAMPICAAVFIPPCLDP